MLGQMFRRFVEWPYLLLTRSYANHVRVFFQPEVTLNAFLPPSHFRPFAVLVPNPLLKFLNLILSRFD